MLSRQGAHGLEEVPLRIVALVGGGADVGRVGVAALGEARESPREQARSRGHCWFETGEAGGEVLAENAFSRRLTVMMLVDQANVVAQHGRTGRQTDTNALDRYRVGWASYLYVYNPQAGRQAGW